MTDQIRLAHTGYKNWETEKLQRRVDRAGRFKGLFWVTHGTHGGMFDAVQYCAENGDLGGVNDGTRRVMSKMRKRAEYPPFTASDGAVAVGQHIMVQTNPNGGWIIRKFWSKRWRFFRNPGRWSHTIDGIIDILMPERPYENGDDLIDAYSHALKELDNTWKNISTTSTHAPG